VGLTPRVVRGQSLGFGRGDDKRDGGRRSRGGAVAQVSGGDSDEQRLDASDTILLGSTQFLGRSGSPMVCSGPPQTVPS
jgi:hypothetical protein